MTSSGRPFADVEPAFQVATEAVVAACKGLTPLYNPQVWINMCRSLGAEEAARRLVISGEIQTGLERLADAGRSDPTVEWEMLQQQWRPTFSEQHLEAAPWRFRQAGVTPTHPTNQPAARDASESFLHQACGHPTTPIDRRLRQTHNQGGVP